jgi:dTDP-4-dehydrorhamnose 3,5-epimerase-like enzyme
MKVARTDIPDVLILEPRVQQDARGFAATTGALMRKRAEGSLHVVPPALLPGTSSPPSPQRKFDRRG